MDELGFSEAAERQVMSRLKSFQRDTVNYVFSRMYGAERPAPRFLVADEVGLGKTMVARGLIAKAILELDRRGVERIDIVYICSNMAIARQNINRLNVLGTDEVSLSSRLTLLPKTLKRLTENRVNFVALTPGTSFDLKSRGGMWGERVLLGQMLEPLLEVLGLTKTTLMNLLQATVSNRAGWRRSYSEPIDYNERLAEDFRGAVLRDTVLRERIARIAHHFARVKTHYPESWHRYWTIGRLRRHLARVSVRALEPDLIILDEFQRFRDLLHDDSDVAEIARDLMTFEDARTLLLSATPYKMLTLRGDGDEDEDHHRDFMRTLEFLFGDEAGQVEEVRLRLGERKRALLAASGTDQATGALTDTLHRVMVRTERVDFTEKRDAMMVDRPTPAALTLDDLKQARFIDHMARSVGAPDTIEYWKSAPYLLNFMKGYKLKEKFEDALEAGEPEVVEALRDAGETLLTADFMETWKPVSPRNARLRTLQSETVDTGLWRLLWMPPALPYVKPANEWEELEAATKTLVFSSWNVVPDAVSALLSYEAERQMTAAEHDVPYSRASSLRGQLITFAESADRLTGMTAMGLVYPSPALAAAVDPLELAREERGPVAPELLEERAVAAIRGLLPERSEPGGGASDATWFWAGIAALDAPRARSLDRWVTRKWPALVAEEGDEGFRKHCEMFSAALKGQVRLGKQPGRGELERVLAAYALGSPAVCASRALRRIAPELPWDSPDLMNAAARVAWSFRTLFNLAETAMMLRADRSGEAYWRIVLDYCRRGNLQAVLDEYVHVLQEQLGLLDVPPEKRVAEVAEAIAEALSIRTARIGFDAFEVDGDRVEKRPASLRTRFALRYGDLRADDQTLSRSTTVRAAFNSPFRPFVLISTSVGQEGLDFHTYCHRVWHWNLPHNPVDLEQREGRVHRYKGHAIRRAVAGRYGLEVAGSADPWESLFGAAQAGEAGHALHPFWLYETESGPCIERCVPTLPMSRETLQLDDLKRSLAVYRLAFGQARQDDLMAYLRRHGAELSEEEIEGLRISLRPPEQSG